MIKDKLLKKFGNDKLLMEISAVRDEEIMRRCIEKILIMNPIKGKTVAVETGTFHGVSAGLLAEYFDEVYTCDIEKGYFKDKNIKYKVWDELGVSDKIHFTMLKDDNEKDQWEKEIPYNFAWIDGNHYDGVMRDYELFKKCGRLLLHDYDSEKAKKQKGMWKRVYDFVNSINPDYIEEPFAIKVIEGE